MIDEEGEVRVLLISDFNKMRPSFEVLPPELIAIIKNHKQGERGPQLAPVKQQVTLRLDKDVLNTFRATSDGWQSRINAALRKAAKRAAP